jgi:RNA polymerase sigma-54 factor
LRQAITILQFSALDLIEYVNQQLNENPVIEPIDTEVNQQQRQEPADPAGTGASGVEVDLKEWMRDRATGDYSNYSVRSNESDTNPLDWVARNDVTLESHLIEQLSFIRNVDDRVSFIARYIIGNLDERGYLEVALEQIAETLKASPDDAEQALFLVQGLDPHGVGARDLRECLIIQLEYAGQKDTVPFHIVDRYLTEVAEGKFNKIAIELQTTPLAVQEAVDYIRTLRPRPGMLYHRSDARYIIPDVTVEHVEGNYVILVNDSASPRLSINGHYQRMLKQEGEAKKFIHEKMNSALWLIKSIEQRRMTIYKVTEAIVEQQQDFFDHGVSCLKPMTLKEIAEKVGLHESTISRATNNKYVQTPRGIFELKYFFSSSLNTSNGETASSESVKSTLKRLVDEEDRKKPLSDQKLTDMLNTEGICISRRTVAKYREELAIPSSARRKRY